jgi:phosphatidylethanolamine-binding protein (PEBP) family uncharacterized protein
MPLTLTSPAFANEAPIPRQYTCDGAGLGTGAKRRRGRGARRAEVESALQGHVLEQAQLMGVYERA